MNKGVTLPPPTSNHQKVQEARAKLAEEQFGEGVDILELQSNQCRWPIGIPGEEGFKFCGAIVKPGLPYCEGHCKAAYTRLRTGERVNPKK
tara:strand:- start:127 stop:399 length:273 start_codon:yes stop_codon:yes gene_type:complete